VRRIWRNCSNSTPSSVENLKWSSNFLNQNRIIKSHIGKNINIACGNARYNNCLNADININVKPDLVCSILNIPYPNKYFDNAFCFHTLEHLEISEIEKAIKELKRVSKKIYLIAPFYLWGWINPHHKSIKIGKKWYSLHRRVLNAAIIFTEPNAP
jgi:hypothetical protein